jgi:mono/diheme cytochrome c family protein
MGKFLGGVVATLAVGVCVGFAVLKLGLFPMGADNPPGTLERRIAHLATDAALSKGAPKQDNPIPITVANLSEGARIYEQHCAVCHGGALHKVSPLQKQFSPAVPQMVNRKPHDPDNEFFWITKHGYRMTGMPSWGKILTDDQIWTVVRFILNYNKLPPEAEAAWQQAARQYSGDSTMVPPAAKAPTVKSPIKHRAAP